MTAFRFALQKALDLRLKQLELEEARFKQQTAALADLDRMRSDLQAAGLHEENSVRASKTLAGHDLAALATFRLLLQKREKELVVRRAECQKQLMTQQAAMLEARRSCRLLERLKERRLAEWRAASNKELEEMASESYLAQWTRKQG